MLPFQEGERRIFGEKKSGSTVYATHMLQIIQRLGMRLTDIINLRSSTAVRVKFPVSKSTMIVLFLRATNLNLEVPEFIKVVPFDHF